MKAQTGWWAIQSGARKQPVTQRKHTLVLGTLFGAVTHRKHTLCVQYLEQFTENTSYYESYCSHLKCILNKLLKDTTRL
jgi:hypothetical protein